LLLSMTGHGEAHGQHETLAVSVELRTINSRYFKLSLRSSEQFNSLENHLETLLKRHIKRGTVQLNLRIQREPTAADFPINEAVLAGYWQQLDAIGRRLNVDQPPRLDSLLQLPGVVGDPAQRSDLFATAWPLIQRTVEQALEHLDQMRQQEGRAMADDLKENCDVVRRQLDQVEQRVPHVAAAYRTRLLERLNTLLAEFQVSAEPADVVREVGIFAERSDIAEEVVRLRSHLDQFADIMQSPESAGRKLEFVVQEMFREANTIGSKGSDPQIASAVVEIKSAIERMREMVQNVE